MIIALAMPSAPKILEPKLKVLILPMIRNKNGLGKKSFCCKDGAIKKNRQKKEVEEE